MKSIVHIALSAALAASLAACAPAEQKESKLQIERSEQATTVATVEAVDLTRRTVKLRSLDGQPFMVRVGKEAVNLPQVKKGDQVEVTYARELEVTLADPGEVVNETDVVVDRAQPGSKPEGSAIAQTRVTATILDLDKEREKVTLKMADGSVATVKVQNPANLDKVKVGDTILIRYLEAVDITVKGKKR